MERTVSRIMLALLLTDMLMFASSINLTKAELYKPETVCASDFTMGVVEELKLTIVYDNNPYDERLETAWGFGCYIQADDITILFDTGGDAEILLENMGELNLDVGEIDVIVLSHIHNDHTGGLFGVLDLNSNVTIYLPASFPDEFKNSVLAYGCEVMEVETAQKICDGVGTTGELGTAIKEQALLIATPSGLIVMTGCAHPGVVEMVEEAVELTEMEVYLVIGGFHLTSSSAFHIDYFISQLRALGVQKTAPCHCSGNLARQRFQLEFGDDYIDAGVGFSLQLPPPIIRVLPEIIEVESGQIFTIAVVAENMKGSCDGLYGLEIQFSWKTTYLEYVSHKKTIPVESYLNPISPSPYPGILHTPTIPIKDEVDENASIPGSMPGTMYWLAEASMVPALGFYGNGTIFTMTFKVKDEPPFGDVEFPLHFATTTLVDTCTLIFHYVEDGLVGIKGASPDINRDGTVDILDLVLASSAYGSHVGDPNWNQLADIASPYGVIDICDLVTCAAYYGQKHL